MVLASTILAIALGLTPANDGRVVEADAVAASREIGRFAEQTDANGVRHLRGFDQHGRAFKVTVGKDGRVQALVGGAVSEFTIADAN